LIEDAVSEVEIIIVEETVEEEVPFTLEIPLSILNYNIT
jgi:hypothetical protein